MPNAELMRLQLQVPHLKLCASRAFWLVACPSQGHEMLFDAHTRSSTLDWTPKVGLEDGLMETIAYFKKIVTR